MKVKFLFIIPFFFCVNIVYGQTSAKKLRHLLKEEYILQIEQSTDSAYNELGLENPNADYEGYTYEWAVEVINDVIKKNFTSKIVSDESADADIYYKIIWYRDRKSLAYGLAFYSRDKMIGQTYILYGLMTETGVDGIVKLFKCKKEIKRILEQEIK